MGISKVVYNTENGEEVLVDLTSDSVTPETLAEGETAHGADGNIIVGTAKKVNVVQSTGSSTTDIMSQAAVTEEIDNLSKEIVDETTARENAIADLIAKGVQQVPLFADSIEECTDTTKVYVLSDGYIYGYMETTTQGGTEEVTERITEGFVDDTRISVSSGNNSSAAGTVTTPYIDITQYPTNVELRLSGTTWAYASQNSQCTCCIYDESKTKLVAFYLISNNSSGGNSDYNFSYISTDASVTFKLTNPDEGFKFKYVRFCSIGTSANAIVQAVYTRSTPSETVTEWTNTGHAFVPADYEDRIIALENQSDVIVPSYWQTELKNKAEAIQLAMEQAGRNKSAFLWYTDSHWANGNSKVSPLLLKWLFNNTPMNKTNFGGDIIGDSLLARTSMDYLYEWRSMVKGLPNHHSVVGNHDYFADYAYSFLIAPEESADMVVGGDFYYYIDNPSERTRYLYIDNMTTDNTELNAQADFLQEALESVPNGWHIVAISHRWFQYTSSSNPTVGSVPIYTQEILDFFDAYNARSNSTTVSNLGYFPTFDFTNATGKVEFCIGGHIHIDYDFASAGGIPIIITASDVNQERSDTDTEDYGTLGTTTEATVFGIVADYTNNKVVVVGVGRGTSREISLN